MNKWDKQPQKASDALHDEHVDEKWLVSYADMMTLLFGLFVILFSISMENQSQFQDNLKKLSDSTTRNPAEEKPESKLDLEKELAEAREKLAAAEKSLAEEREKSAALDKQVVELTEEVKQLREKLKNSQELEMRVAELGKSVSNSNQVQAVLNQKNLDLAKLLAEKTKMAEEMARLEEQLKKAKELEAQIAQLEEQLRRARELEAKVAELQSALIKAREFEQKNQDLQEKLNQAKAQVKDSKSTERELSSLQANDQKNQALMDKQKDDNRALVRQLEEAKQEIKKLNDELKLTERKNSDNQSYLFVILKWSSEKHDLDLSVTDPNGKEFNFKKKSFEGSPGLFALDSRSGPGAEIWQSSNPVPGTYTIRLKMYNNYGNNEQAVVSGSILSNKSSIVIENRKLESKSGATITLKVSIDNNGVAKLQ